MQLSIHVLHSHGLPEIITDLIYTYIDGQETEYYQALEGAVDSTHAAAIGAVLTDLCRDLGAKATFEIVVPSGWPPKERKLAELGADYVIAALDGDREKCVQLTKEALEIVDSDRTQATQRAGDHLARIIDMLIHTLTCALACAETCPKGYDEFVWQQIKAKIGEPEKTVDGKSYYAHKFDGSPS